MIMLMTALLTMIRFLPGADNGYDYTDDNGDDDDQIILMRKIRMII